MCDNPVSLRKSDLMQYVGALSPEKMEKLEKLEKLDSTLGVALDLE